MLQLSSERKAQTLLLIAMHYWGTCHWRSKVSNNWSSHSSLLITVVQQPGTSSPPSQLKHSSEGVNWMCRASFTWLGFIVGFTHTPSNEVQWNPSITDTLGTQNFVCYNEVSPISGASDIFPVGVVCVTGLLSTTNCVFRAFLCCTQAGNATQRLVLRVTVLI